MRLQWTSQSSVSSIVSFRTLTGSSGPMYFQVMCLLQEVFFFHRFFGLNFANGTKPKPLLDKILLAFLTVLLAFQLSHFLPSMKK